MAKRILIVKETLDVLAAFTKALSGAGFEIEQARTIPQAAEKYAKNVCDLVIVDLLLTTGDPIMLMSGILGARPHTLFIGVTASGSMRQASVAMEKGAFDYLVRPFDEAVLLKVVNNAIRQIEISRANHRDSKWSVPKPQLGLDQVWPQILRLAPSTADVFLDGNHSATRLAVAQQLHRFSHKSDLPFLVLDPATVSSDWFEDALSTDLLDQGGTVFLDDICDLEFGLQTELLRFLQTSVVRRKKGPSRFNDIRVMCGSSKMPEQAVDGGILREDLFYRLNVVRLTVPSVQAGAGEKTDQIAKLIMQAGWSSQTMSPEAWNALLAYGVKAGGEAVASVLKTVAEKRGETVLELKNLPDPVQKTAHLGVDFQNGLEAKTAQDRVDTLLVDLVDAGMSLAQMERAFIEAAIGVHEGSVPRAAKQLKVAPSTLYRKLESWSK